MKQVMTPFGKFVLILSFVFGLSIGVMVSYLIACKLNYFGASLITVRDILGVWIIIPVITTGASGFLGALFVERHFMVYKKD